MAVFTPITFEEAAAFVERFAVGPLRRLDPIASGIENTNYFASTQRGDYVLTLFERLTHDQLPFYLELMRHLAQRGIPAPEPLADAQGRLLHTLHGKPAALVVRLPGRPQMAPTAAHCAQVGTLLARMHLATQDFGLHQPNLRGLDWWRRTVPTVLPFVSAEQAQLLKDELQFQDQLAASPAYAALPRGAVHADLFRDNVLFEDERLTGCFDFYFAGVDTWLFDLAVALNDWCVDLPTGRLEEARASAMLRAYGQVRELTHDELRLLPSLLRAGALRFWVSRLWDLHLPRDAHVLTPHDPQHFERILRDRIGHPWHYLPDTPAGSGS